MANGTKELTTAELYRLKREAEVAIMTAVMDFQGATGLSVHDVLAKTITSDFDPNGVPIRRIYEVLLDVRL